MAAGTSTTQPDSGNSAPTQQSQLDQLQVWLRNQQKRGQWTCSNSTLVDKQLQKVKQSTEAIKQGYRQHQLRLVTSNGSCIHEYASAVTCLQLLTQVLLRPPEDLYSGISGVPAAPAEGLELAAEEHQRMLRAHLQLLTALLDVFEGSEVLAAARHQQDPESSAPQQHYPQQDLGSNTAARHRPRHFQGVVEIEVLPEDHCSDSRDISSQRHSLQQQLVRVLLAAALYAADANSVCYHRPSSSESFAALSTHRPLAVPADAAEDCTRDHHKELQMFAARTAHEGLQLDTPWSTDSSQQCALSLSHYLLAIISGDSSSKCCNISDTLPCKHLDVQGTHTGACAPVGDRIRADAAPEHPQQLALQQMLHLLLSELRTTLVAQQKHRQLQDRGEFTAYSGPSTFHRCLAARQLAWIAQQLSPSSLADSSIQGQLLPLVLATIDDPSPSVRQYGYAVLGWLGVAAPVGALTWQGALLREEARKLVIGCEESCWATAMPAATSILLALEGKNQRSPTYHAFVLDLVREAERSAHKPKPRLVFMACLARLVPVLGLYTVRHFASLMPLLTEWVHAYDVDSSVVALQLLGLLVTCAWPRMGIHAKVLQEHVEEAMQQERVEQGLRRPAPLQEDEQTVLRGTKQHQRSLAQGGVCDATGVGSRRYEAAKHLSNLLQEISSAGGMTQPSIC